MLLRTRHGESSATRQLLGTGKPMCIICDVRLAFNNGIKTYPTCGLTCAELLKLMQEQDNNPTAAQNNMPADRPLCVVCNVRPRFNNGRRAFPTCGHKCANTKEVNDMIIASRSVMKTVNGGSSVSMCEVCDQRPKYEIGGKVHRTCGHECAVRLRALNVQIETLQEIVTDLVANDDKGRNIDQGTITAVSSKKSAPSSNSDLPIQKLIFECIICFDTLGGRDLSQIACEHTICIDCMKQFILSALDEGQYPIICPSCKIGKQRLDKPISIIDDKIMWSLGLGEAELSKFEKLQMLLHSVEITCPKCKESMFVDRNDYKDTKIIFCPLLLCNFSWCRDCKQEIVHVNTPHSCDGSKELEHLIKENGWKICPGCQTPVQKSEGCNHMACLAPGCNTHFCYLCGESIAQSVISEEIKDAKTKHYVRCQLFEH
ncbi:hypothetical protein BDN70DRAFT_855991 [Pholiota conissans]|uniref:RBR-type E3 ubiquitin transferase n=1 Tax=Pholiota conissans TaxID=109636 RepID=A0A9P6D2A6_9AGAR|nr:hypothetical protein BDN70DRAFT_855991 [Pholiota conissans]